MSEKDKCTEKCYCYDTETGNCCAVDDFQIKVDYGADCFLDDDSFEPRDYVIVCNRHRKKWEDLLFWGKYTNFEEKRRFGGYTSDLNKCERYTLTEIKTWRGYSSEHYIMFEDIDPAKFYDYPDIICTISQLESIGFQKATIMRK